jgi:hypothetical protein
MLAYVFRVKIIDYFDICSCVELRGVYLLEVKVM